MRNSVIAMMFLLSLGSTATRAAIVVWQTAETLTPNSFIVEQGNFATRLDLGCNATVGECKWRITTHAWIGDGSLNGYDVWLRDPAGVGTNLSISDTSFAGAPWSNVQYAHQNSGPFLSRIGAYVPVVQPAVPAGPTIHTMYSYVLTSQAGVAPGTLTQLRAGSDGFLGFEPGDPIDPWRIVAFGANPGFEIGGGEWPNPVIRINYVPEPATAAMLLAPAVLLLRRRRSRDRSHRRDQRRRD
ncbi:hypothetical protein RAS2_19120 [Phycisphaerae bacterium RAS2]|nr:hypothetical protein RAS2_19120 [Phycisphaerae bacterium RAS2]